MKIKPWDRYVINIFLKFFAVLSAGFSIGVVFFPIPEEIRKKAGVALFNYFNYRQG